MPNGIDVQNKQRKITLCDDDNSPGEVLVDVNAFFTDGRGRVAEDTREKDVSRHQHKILGNGETDSTP